MWILEAVTLAAVLASGLESGAMEGAQQVQEPLIWLDRGVDPVLEAGDRVRIYYRTNADAYVAILQIDTDGTTRMLYPRSPTETITRGQIGITGCSFRALRTGMSMTGRESGIFLS